MACKCKEVKTKDPEAPCADANEESFRVAYNAKLKESTQATARVAELEAQIVRINESLRRGTASLESAINGLQNYVAQIMSVLPPKELSKIRATFGDPPLVLRVK